MSEQFLELFNYEEIKKIGRCLKDGELVLSPFEGPIEEERMGDPDLRDDDLNFARDNLCVSLEPQLRRGKDTKEKVTDGVLFKYFLDGSLRTKYVGDYGEGRLSCPIITSEIGVTVVRIESRKVKPFILKKRQYFIFPHKDSGLLSDTTHDRLDGLREELSGSNSRIRIEFLQKTDISGDVKYSMLGKARSIMHDFEHEVASSFTRSNIEWLVMDGALRKYEFMQLPNTIGLAKSFSRKPLLDLGNGKPIMLPPYLRLIKEGERSAVFKKEQKTSQDVAFWYVRLRSLPQMEPLEGIVKIDYNLGKDELEKSDVELINKISGEIFLLRDPSVYPRIKWPSTIYPIRVAEEHMASRFASKEILGQTGRWIEYAIRS